MQTAVSRQTESPALGGASSGFVLSASGTILFNTVLTCAKEAWHPLNRFMASLTGHHWITHGLADLVLFLGLGVILWNTRATDRISPDRLTFVLVASVVISTLGLIVWFTVG